MTGDTIFGAYDRAALDAQYDNRTRYADHDVYFRNWEAGGHLAAMVMAADWTAFGDDLPPDLVKGGCAISGLYDLEPIRLTYLNDALGLDAEAAARNSPVLHPPTRKAPIIVAVGAEESEEYHRQAGDFVSVLANREVPCEHIIAPGLNHYSIMDQFMRPDTALSLAVGRQMGL